MWGAFHLGTTWPPLLSGWKSPGISIPGVWVIFAENLKVINANKCSPSLVREPRFVLFRLWTDCTALSGLKVHVLNKMLWPFTTSARTTRSKSFLARPEFYKLQLGKEKHKVHHVLNIMLWPCTKSAQTTRSMPFPVPISFPWWGRRHTFSCLFLNENHELSRSHLRQIDLRRQGLHSRDLLPCWLRSKVADVAY